MLDISVEKKTSHLDFSGSSYFTTTELNLIDIQVQMKDVAKT